MPLDENEERLIRLDEQVKRNSSDIKELKDGHLALTHTLSSKISALSGDIHKIQITLSESRGKSRIIMTALSMAAAFIGSVAAAYIGK